MFEISARTLVVAVQAVDAEIVRLRSLPENQTVPGDEELLVQYETAAEELEEVYADAAQLVVNLPAYAQLVHRED